MTEPGVQDCVLLNEVNENELSDNLKARFDDSKIYTLIGDVVIAVNPYKHIDQYGEKYIDMYRGKTIFELPPHIYSIADDSYRMMRDRNQDQCVIITGESGAGKTETSKYFMKYIAEVSGSTEKVNAIKSQLLNSNPLLEAFGNAKTMRNDNSSRFGKYMELEFDFKADPIGGKITTYLLEKSRVIQRSEEERTFHIFYQLVRGATPEIREYTKLTDKAEDYGYLKSSVTTIPEVDDKEKFQEVLSAFDIIGIKPEDKKSFLQAVAAILHLGNIQFDAFSEENPNSRVANAEVLSTAADLLGVTPNALSTALTSRVMKDKKQGGEDMVVPLTVPKAQAARDACAKAIYGRLFDSLVAKINDQIMSKEKTKKSVIGVLDIYGFEIFQKNGFEQFIINFCNEKLQQIFIELTLRSEQAEYQSEGIEWKNIEFFNNQVICELIESKKNGILTLLDEECAMVGNTSDKTFLDKLNNIVSKHPHFDSREKSKSDKTLPHDSFRLKHYAGDVLYNASGFLERNTDTLHADVKVLLRSSTCSVFRELFNENGTGGTKRIETLASQFRTSMNALMENLLSKNPHYIRCIKPNSSKTPGVFDNELVKHQIKYLGLLENILVKRAGYCHRSRFDKFLYRYKMLSAATWPAWNGSDVDGIKKLFEAYKIPESEYAFGKTKVFIRSPRTLHLFEKKRLEIKIRLASKIQATWHMYKTRTHFLLQKACAIKIQATYRGHLGRLNYKKALRAVALINRVGRGLVARRRFKFLKLRFPRYAVPLLQRVWRRHRGRRFINEVRTVVDKIKPKWWTAASVWPKLPKSKYFQVISDFVKNVYLRIEGKKYRKALPSDKKAYLDWKATASTHLGVKAGYLATVPTTFKSDHINLEDEAISSKISKIVPDFEKILIAIPAQKYNRSDFKMNGRTIILSSTSLYVLAPDMTLKHRVALESISGISVSKCDDGIFIVHIPEDERGDWILKSEEYVFEFVSRLWLAMHAGNRKRVAKMVVADSLTVTARRKPLNFKFQKAPPAKGAPSSGGNSAADKGKPGAMVSLKKNRSEVTVLVP